MDPTRVSYVDEGDGINRKQLFEKHDRSVNYDMSLPEMQLGIRSELRVNGKLSARYFYNRYFAPTRLNPGVSGMITVLPGTIDAGDGLWKLWPDVVFRLWVNVCRARRNREKMRGRLKYIFHDSITDRETVEVMWSLLKSSGEESSQTYTRANHEFEGMLYAPSPAPPKKSNTRRPILSFDISSSRVAKARVSYCSSTIPVFRVL